MYVDVTRALSVRYARFFVESIPFCSWLSFWLTAEGTPVRHARELDKLTPRAKYRRRADTAVQQRWLNAPSCLLCLAPCAERVSFPAVVAAERYSMHEMPSVNKQQCRFPKSLSIAKIPRNISSFGHSPSPALLASACRTSPSQPCALLPASPLPPVVNQDKIKNDGRSQP